MSKTWVFPAGEVGVEIDPNVDEVVNFYLRSGSANEILSLLMQVDAQSRRCRNQEFELYVPYVPYGRQDRVTSPGTSFSLSVFASLINRCCFRKVHVFDQHSVVTSNLISNVQHYRAEQIMEFLPWNLLPVAPYKMVFLAPDKGAKDRATECATRFGAKRTVYAEKHRNPTTGRIEHIDIIGDLSQDEHVLVVDDICDGGGTFLALHDAIKERCASLSLYVSHGIFSAGYLSMKERFHAVITTDSFTPSEDLIALRPAMSNRPPKSHVIPLNKLIPNWK